MPPLRHIALYYETHGDGAPLLLIHGLGSSTLDWAPQVAHFSERFRVITLDVRGHGRSDKPPGPYSVPIFAGDLVELLDALHIESAHLAGISMGGMIAFQLAVDAPQRVRSLTIVNSGHELKVCGPEDALSGLAAPLHPASRRDAKARRGARRTVVPETRTGRTMARVRRALGDQRPARLTRGLRGVDRMGCDRSVGPHRLPGDSGGGGSGLHGVHLISVQKVTVRIASNGAGAVR